MVLISELEVSAVENELLFGDKGAWNTYESYPRIVVVSALNKNHLPLSTLTYLTAVILSVGFFPLTVSSLKDNKNTCL